MLAAAMATLPQAPHHKPCIKGITMISHQPFHLRGHTTHMHTHIHTLTELDCLCIQQTVFVHQHSMLNSYTPLDHQ